jgi:hypothetical protein
MIIFEPSKVINIRGDHEIRLEVADFLGLFQANGAPAGISIGRKAGNLWRG